jgi:hypothetical protein
MSVDLRKDAKAARKLLEQRVREYAANAARARRVPPVSAIVVGYCLCQDGWVIVQFDTRPAHERDGHWSSFENRDVFELPHWEAAYEAVQEKPVTFILPDGSRRVLPKGSTDEKVGAVFGRVIRDVLLRAKKDGLFDALPKRDNCQLDVEEFNGMWAWPAYEKLGKVNLA